MSTAPVTPADPTLVLLREIELLAETAERQGGLVPASQAGYRRLARRLRQVAEDCRRTRAAGAAPSGGDRP